MRRLHPTPSTQVTMILAALALASLSLACPKEEPQPAQRPETETPTTQRPVLTSTHAPSAPATPQTGDPLCIAPRNTGGAPIRVEAFGRTFERTGTTLVEKTTDPDSRAVLGVLADIKEDTPENLQNLKVIVEFFRKQKADAIVIAGDLGETRAQIVAVLEVLATAKLPTFAVIGNREERDDFNGAFEEIAQRHSAFFNLNHIRLAMLDDVALVSVPGYFNRAYIHATGGCQYFPNDIEATKPIIKDVGDKPVVLVSHGPPKQEGADALDRTLEQDNVGDPALAQLLRESGVKFGIFANIHEAGGRATNLAGTQLIASGKMSPELYLNPGPADAVRWAMNDRTESVGMAAVMIIDGKQASFLVHRLAPKATE